MKIGAGLLRRLGELCGRPATPGASWSATRTWRRSTSSASSTVSRPPGCGRRRVVLPAGRAEEARRCPRSSTASLRPRRRARRHGRGPRRRRDRRPRRLRRGDLPAWRAAGAGADHAPGQVDASVGGKVAVDFRAGKNYVGTFYQPALVVEDLDTLRDAARARGARRRGRGRQARPARRRRAAGR